MTIKEELDAELKDALRAKDRLRLDVIRQINTEVATAAAEPGFSGDVDDALYTKVMSQYTKKMSKAKAEYEGYGEKGADMVGKLGFEIDYLARWLPEQASADDVRAIVDAAIAELGADDPKQVGQVMGHIMKNHQGLDGAAVNAAVRSALGA
jgi:uncharacterized protein YqeY